MKTFMAVYTGTPAAAERSGWNQLDDASRTQREQAGMEAWHQWGLKHKDAIIDKGAPLGRTKRVAPDGITDIRNNLAAYTIVRAESHEEAARIFENHPHFTIFPGDSVEVMECLPIPGMDYADDRSERRPTEPRRHPMPQIPAQYRDLLEGPVVVSLATLMSDGTPQVQPVWCGFDGTHILVNTEKGRQKYRNLSRRKVATILAVDPGNDQRWLEVRGTVVAETEAGAFEHIDELARLYLKVDKYPYHQPGDVRVLFKILPKKIATMESSMPDFGT